MTTDIRIFDSALDVNACYKAVQHSEAGSVNTFVGTVRDATSGRMVSHLEYEAYEPMAISEMTKLADQAREKWPIKGVVIHHRVGTLAIGDPAVVIAVATPHRQAGFEACKFLIDTLKQTVPIWKKEVFSDGETWVSAHP